MQFVRRGFFVSMRHSDVSFFSNRSDTNAVFVSRWSGKAEMIRFRIFRPLFGLDKSGFRGFSYLWKCKCDFVLHKDDVCSTRKHTLSLWRFLKWKSCLTVALCFTCEFNFILLQIFTVWLGFITMQSRAMNRRFSMVLMKRERRSNKLNLTKEALSARS